MAKRKRFIEFDQVTTRGGDTGESSLYNGERYRKDDLLFETMGDVDELNSHIGALKAAVESVKIARRLESIQQTLIVIGGEAATPVHDELFGKIGHVTEEDVTTLEKWERELLDSVKIEERFILPGGTPTAAVADIARTVCRRAERKVVACIRDRVMPHLIPAQHYLNRLSDYLFIVARALEQDTLS